jgi:hypothetical protein
LKENPIYSLGEHLRSHHLTEKISYGGRLLIDHATRLYEDVGAAEVLIEQFFEEILLTYRLIFGQDDRSHKAFSRMVPVWEEQRGRASWETTWACDPMLLILCGKSATSEEARKIYDEIDANEPANCYDLNTEFPFFRKRLLELQQFIKQHQPQNVRALLNDRRDVAAWYTIWNSQVSVDFLLRFTGHTKACTGSYNIRYNNHFLDGALPRLAGMASDTCQATAATRSRSCHLKS